MSPLPSVPNSPTPIEILLVEDSEADILLTQEAFAEAAVCNRLRIARDGVEALEMLRNLGDQPRPDVILLDINMPRMNGLELLEVLRSDPEFVGLNVFIMTTSDLDTDRLRAQQLAVSGYIIKPLTFDKFGEGGATVDGFSLFLDLVKMKQ